ncbi:MAG TPA: hypothetical protein VGM53_34455 [Streptosporangiaceae bacterium]|jgi:hypothetical protein
MTDRPVATRAGEDSGEHRAAPPPQASAGTAGSWRDWRSWTGRSAALARQNWLACLLMAAGLVLRVLAQLAYRPALIYVDTTKYLYGAYPGSDPLGYKLPLKVLLAVGNLGLVAAVQHLLGLAMGAVLYILLRRRGVNRWLAAIAMAPVLLDAYQLQMEQTIMPDVWFEAMVVAGLALLLWRPVLTTPFIIAGGLVLGASATMRQLGEALIFPVVLFALVAGGGWRRTLVRSAALIAAFAVPILLYSGVSDIETGHFWLARGQTSLGREAAAADCATLKVPADVRALCPSPSAQAKGPDWLEHITKQSPLYTAPLPPGVGRRKLFAQLGSAIRHQQPLRIAGAIARDAVRLFALTRQPVESVTPIARWQFQDHYAVYPQWTSLRGATIMIGLQKAGQPFHSVPLNPSYGGKAQVSRPLAQFLRAYQFHGGYTPGPVYLVASLLALAGSLLLLRWRRLGQRARQAALACLLFTATAVVVVLGPDVYEFSWRYELPAVVVLVPAGVLGLSVLWTWRRERKQPAAGAEPVTDAQA